MIPEMGGHAAAAPWLGHPGYALAASRPGAKCSLLPPGIGTWGGGRAGRGSPPSREPEPGGSAAASPRAGSRDNPATRRPPQCGAWCPRRASPQRAGGDSGGPAGSRLGSATYLGPRAAPAEPRPGRAGGRGRGARAAGALPSSPAFRAAAALGAGRQALHHPPRAPRGGRASRPEGLPAAGSQLRTPRAAPGR